MQHTDTADWNESEIERDDLAAWLDRGHTFHRAPGTTGLYLRDDNAQIWADTYQPIWHGRLADGTEGAFYTYDAAERWIAAHDAPSVSPFVRRARAGTLPAKVIA